MPRLPFALLTACAIHTPAPAEQYPDVVTCLTAAEGMVVRNQAYDRFARSSDPADAVILRWAANPITVAAIGEIEWRARRRAEPVETWEDVTVRRGLNESKVDAVAIVAGHGLSWTWRMQRGRQRNLEPTRRSKLFSGLSAWRKQHRRP